MRTFKPRATGILLLLLILAAAALLWSRSGVEGPTHVVVLGSMDDAGRPFPGCHRTCCGPAAESRTRAALALVEPETQATQTSAQDFVGPPCLRQRPAAG
mgnify:CR=1 FL=1